MSRHEEAGENEAAGEGPPKPRRRLKVDAALLAAEAPTKTTIGVGERVDVVEAARRLAESPLSAAAKSFAEGQTFRTSSVLTDLAAKTAAIGVDLDRLQRSTRMDPIVAIRPERAEVGELRELNAGLEQLVSIQDRAMDIARITNRQIEVLVQATTEAGQTAARQEKWNRAFAIIAILIGIAGVGVSVVSLVLTR